MLPQYTPVYAELYTVYRLAESMGDLCDFCSEFRTKISTVRYFLEIRTLATPDLKKAMEAICELFWA